MYGYSKHLFDLWALKNGLLNKMLGLKYFNVFGPNEWHKGRMASAILRMVPEALSTKKIQLFASRDSRYADGEQLRDFIYVKDCVAITADLLEGNTCGILNVGSGEASSWNRLAKAVFSSLSLSVYIEYIAMPEDLIGKYQYRTQADIAKLQTALSRPPCRFSLEKAVFDYVNSHILPERPW
jgi:ADP-L-glycero-D-manno-heptose 6-epimerase